jgi:hypothetical protein
MQERLAPQELALLPELAAVPHSQLPSSRPQETRVMIAGGFVDLGMGPLSAAQQ